MNNGADYCIFVNTTRGIYLKKLSEAIGMMEPKRETLAITVDKSHLITIGEKLYTQSIELIRELVNNAYDADASVVEVEITEDRIVIKDNGSVVKSSFRQIMNLIHFNDSYLFPDLEHLARQIQSLNYSENETK